MTILLICIAFSKTLTFGGLTLTGLMEWMNYHPFIFFIMVIEMLLWGRTK